MCVCVCVGVCVCVQWNECHFLSCLVMKARYRKCHTHTQFFNVVSYIIGGRVFTLNDIESGVLRSNRKPVGAFKRPFPKDDPRSVSLTSLLDPTL